MSFLLPHPCTHIYTFTFVLTYMHAYNSQGFHNWLIYSGVLDKYMNVKIFQQGEGPVNTVGAFKNGPNALLKFTLEEWGILKGQAPEAFVANWNGDKSPVVHQLDRFLGTDSLGAHYAMKLGVAQNLG